MNIGEYVAWLVEQQYLCEVCHRVHVRLMFDRRFVCAACRAKLERNLVKHG